MTLDRLRALLIEDAEAAARLGAVEREQEFIAAALALMAERGFASPDLGMALEQALRGQGRPKSAPVIEVASPAAGWMPASLEPGGAGLDWRWIGPLLNEAFYEDDLNQARWRPLNRLAAPRTPADALPDLPARGPDGLIFHMSRCGSTLTARMLGAAPGWRAISEAAVLDQAVRAPDLDDGARIALLRAVVAALAHGDPERLFLKLDCWHARDLPLFRRAFPDTPWVFLHRDPVEVMVSQRRERGRQMVPDLVPPAYYGLELPCGVPNDAYCLRVLGAIMQAGLDGLELGGGLAVDYRDQPQAVEAKILPHFGLTPTPVERQAMAEAARHDAKGLPGVAFAPDSGAKQAAADPALRALCDALAPLRQGLLAQGLEQAAIMASTASSTVAMSVKNSVCE